MKATLLLCIPLWLGSALASGSRVHNDPHTSQRYVVAPGNDHHAALKRICGSTDHPDLCFSSLSPLLTDGKETVDSALDASVKADDKFGHYALDEIKKMARNAPPDMRPTFKDCIDFYETALEGFTKTLQAHPVHDLGTMKVQLSAAITWLETCEDEFSESGSASPLKGFAEKLQSMTSDSLAIVDQMHA